MKEWNNFDNSFIPEKINEYEDLYETNDDEEMN